MTLALWQGKRQTSCEGQRDKRTAQANPGHRRPPENMTSTTRLNMQSDIHVCLSSVLGSHRMSPYSTTVSSFESYTNVGG
jgi:hypothetical protein